MPKQGGKQMANQTYRVGIIGCGGTGRSHSRSWGNNPRAEVVAAMDIYEESAKRLADGYDIPATYTDVEEMLKKEDLDIVSITTWQGPRAEATVAAAKAGVKGIIGEKPMAASLGQADAMLEACEANDVKLIIGHQRRYSAPNIEARRLVAAGRNRFTDNPSSQCQKACWTVEYRHARDRRLAFHVVRSRNFVGDWTNITNNRSVGTPHDL